MTTRRQEKKETKAFRKSLHKTRLVLDAIVSYSDKLESFKHQRGRKPTVPYLQATGLEVRHNKNLHILGFIPVPKDIQALMYEEYELRKEIDDTYRRYGEMGRSKKGSVIARIVVINLIVAPWTRKQIQNKKASVFNQHKDIETYVDGDWNLLFVEKTTLQLPGPK
jgi:hypothetical protein